jgi:hypothetical protein
MQQGVDERRLAVIDVGHDGDVTRRGVRDGHLLSIAASAVAIRQAASVVDPRGPGSCSINEGEKTNGQSPW